MRHNLFTYALLFALLSSVAVAFETERDSWPDSPQADIDAVSNGELNFKSLSPTTPVHHLHNQIKITAESLSTGWVHLHQCHEHLDSVSAVQITFNSDRVKNLTVKHSKNIGRAWVEGSNVELESVGKSASICIDADTRTLTEANSGQFILRNGPFMRRFLDGYYPMRVSFTVTVPETKLELLAISPSPQPGLSLLQTGNTVYIDALFEGKLNTEIEFTRL
ncbi:MAG: hypothetical protein V3V12_08175 [Gammaproteobacteria bacterium]